MCQAIEDMMRESKVEGISQGIAQGVAQGINQGIAQGITQGIAQGITQGIAQGMTQGKIHTLAELISAGLLSKEQAANNAGMSVDELMTEIAKLNLN